MSYMTKATEDLLNRARKAMPMGEAPIVAGQVAIGERLHRMVAAMESLASTRNPTDTDAGHALKVSKAASSIRAEVKAAKAKLNAALSEGSRNLQAKIDALTGLKAQSPNAAEVRAIFRGMDAAAKMNLVREAAEAQDGELLSALLGVHPFLSGIDKAFQQDMVRHYENKVAPDLVAEQAALLEVDQAVSTLIGAADHVAAEAERPDFVAKAAEMARKAELAQAEFNQAVAPPSHAA